MCDCSLNKQKTEGCGFGGSLTVGTLELPSNIKRRCSKGVFVCVCVRETPQKNVRCIECKEEAEGLNV